MQIIGGQFKKRQIFSPKGDQTRPTKNRLRETLFNICAPYIEDAVFGDFFAGSGAVGLEALSRGAKFTYFIENHKNALLAIKKNIDLLKVNESSNLIKGDVFHSFPQINGYLDILFADAPYCADPKKSYSLRLLRLLNEHSLIKEGGRLFLEMRRSEDIDYQVFDTFELVKKRDVGESQLVELKQITLS